jgi:molybdate transport system substrate-binding protein
MATRQVLADLIARFAETLGVPVGAEAVGGVDVARRVRAGEAFDIVALASNVIDELIAGGQLVAGSRVDLACSGIAIAVPAGAPHLALDSEDAVRRAVQDATSMAYSTGPSGTHLARLFERWGIAASVESRLVRPPPGVPVARLIAEGRVALGFQQASELIDVPGVDVLGPLPPAIQLLTVFAAGLAATSTQPDAARHLLRLLVSAEAADDKRRHGMEPA